MIEIHPPSRRHHALAGVLALLCALAAPPLAALKEDEEQPVYIEADAVELDEKQALSLYIGHVDYQQGSIRILADEVLVHHKPDRQPQKIIAVGNPVRYRQLLDNEPEEVTGHAQRMEYDTDREEITLIDKAELMQSGDHFASDRIVYNRLTQRVTAGTSASGRERVKITIQPDAQ